MNKLPSGPSFAVLCGISLVLWFRPLLSTFSLAFADDRYTHILLILPLVVVLIVQGWLERGVKPQQWTPAATLLIAAVFIAGVTNWGHFGGSSDVRLAIEMLGLVCWWIASFAFCFGLSALRSFSFPLFFLLWMVPLPAIVLDPIVAGLQQGSVLAAHWLFLLFRVPVSRAGITLLIPGLEIDVTPDCSSIRSSLMLLVTTMVLVHLLLRAPWRQILVVAIAIPLSVAKNGLRIFTIGMLGTRIDESYLTGRLHRHGGIVFFLIALVAIFLLLWFLRRGESAEASAPRLNTQRS